jgi:hypothetical protein
LDAGLERFVLWCARLGSDDDVVVLRFGGLKVGPFFIQVTIGGGGILRKMFADSRLEVRPGQVVN